MGHLCFSYCYLPTTTKYWNNKL